MTYIDWKHLILAPFGYSGHSRRIARMRLGGAIFPPPYRSGSWSGEGSWSPTTDITGREPDMTGGAPSDYSPPFMPLPIGADGMAYNPYDPRTYVFAFWSVNGRSSTGTPLFETYSIRNPSPGGGPWNLQAKAWYVWNYGGGGGGNVIEIDAFSITDNDFIPDYFVDVAPDGPPEMGALTTIANEDGYVDTDRINKAETLYIKARNIIGDGPYQYRFVQWSVVDSLTSGDPLPRVYRAEIIAHTGNIMKATAMYERISIQQPPVLERFSWGFLFGNLADGSYIIIRPGDLPPIPVGPVDPFITKRF